MLVLSQDGIDQRRGPVRSRQIDIRAGLEKRLHARDPLLEGDRCLVHGVAKPIACLALHPGEGFTEKGMSAYEAAHRLNDRYFGKTWKLRSIPILLRELLQRKEMKPRIRKQRKAAGARRSQ